MTRIISRRISNLEDVEVLAKEETEKAARVERASRSLAEGLSIAAYKPINTGGRYHSSLQKTSEWLFFFDFALFSNLLADLGILRSVETFSDIRLNF